MTFFRPEFLKALILLVIPIIIHLFHFRKFIPTRFTNVVFLQQLKQETRQSARLKKWLLLLIRLAYFSALILAFARPTLSSNDTLVQKQTTVVYLDNSYSMEAKGPYGMSLLKQMTQELYAYIDQSATQSIHWFTNNEAFYDMPIENFKSTVLNTPATHHNLSPKEVFLKSASFFKAHPSAQRHLIYISDFQGITSAPHSPEGISTQYIPLAFSNNTNLSLDTVYFDRSNADRWEIKAEISGAQSNQATAMLRLLSDSILIAKSALVFNDSGKATASFERNETGAFDGQLILTDQGLPFDNVLYFNHSKPAPVRILTLSGLTDKDLFKVFDSPDFNYQNQQEFALDFSDFANQDFIILNGLKTINRSLLGALEAFQSRGGHVLFVPHPKGSIEHYQAFFNRFGLGTLDGSILTTKKLTDIEENHPLFASVFEKEFTSFQYPSINSCLSLKTSATSLLTLEDNHAFLVEREKVYAFLSSLNAEGGNFTQSPLFVATIIQMARQSAPDIKPYYTLGTPAKVGIKVAPIAEQVITLKHKEDRFVPRQTPGVDQITLLFDQEPQQPGQYKATYLDQTIGTISFNAPRTANQPSYLDSGLFNQNEVYTSLAEAFAFSQQSQENQELWKWFVIFALACLVTELLILKLR